MALEFKRNLTETVERMQRFWAMEDPEDRVPIQIFVPKPEDGPDGTFFGRRDDYIKNMEAHFSEQVKIMDDSIPTVVPQYGHALISALCGSPIRGENKTVWSVPIIDAAHRADELYIDWERPWSQKILADYNYLLERSRDRYAVGEYEIEGISDTMSALRGAQGVLTDFMLHPAAAQKLAARVTDILIEFAEWNHQNIGTKQELLGGISTVYRFWMPARSGVTTEDHMVMVSSDYYREHVQPHTARLASSLTKTLMEIHQEGMHHITAMAETKGVDLLTVHPFRLTDSQQEAMRRQLGKKYFRMGCCPDTVYDILKFTGLQGILLCYHAETVCDAEKMLSAVEKATQRIKKES